MRTCWTSISDLPSQSCRPIPEKPTREFAANVLAWFKISGRKELPWQIDPTPYRVWVSEIMLQQTQVTTVIPYFVNFMESFPDIDALATASIDDVLHHWSGLGYYARARNLHKSAQIIRNNFAGRYPLEFDDVVALPGIGRSTAGAILALSDNQRYSILDGNVKRVLSRYYAVDGWPGNAFVANRLWDLADRCTPTKNVAAYTQAMMDLGATVCTTSKPVCERCPLLDDCEARSSGREMQYPGRKPKKAKPLKQTKMILLHSDNAVFLQRRPAAGIWGGLWSLPELGNDEDASNWCGENFDLSPDSLEQWETIRHSFTHFDLDINPIAVRVDDGWRRVADTDDQLWYQLDSPQKVGLAAPVAGLLDKLKF